MWEEDEKILLKDSSQMIDVAFHINCKTLPYDHAFELSQKIINLLPWMKKSKLSGIQTLHGPDSGNGWVRSENDEIFLSKRTRLILRVPRSEVSKTKSLESEVIKVLGSDIKIGKSTTKSFLVVRDLICRFVLCDDSQDEEEFLSSIRNELRNHNIVIKKAICGKTKNLMINGNKKFTRSLMIADLSKENSILLQDLGVGDGRLFGCGIFLPHKSIDAVANFKED
tara:strand:- start:1148 stop:1822 length:675 start_codon:yes stop_codon:yes gene_type:complete